MRLIHFSPEILGPIMPVKQEWPKSAKPQGLWVSDEDEEDNWSRYCAGIKLDLGRFAYEVWVRAGANLLVIDSLEGVARFSNEFRMQRDGSAYRDVLFAHFSEYGIDTGWIDWVKVAEAYHGIIISPHQRAIRMDWEYRWYYAWDCASGCIWNPEAILEARLANRDQLIAEGWVTDV